MNFWIITVAVLTVSAATISWPLLTGTSKDRFAGLALLVLMPLAGLLLYQQVGTPAALNAVNLEATNNGTPAHLTDAPSMEQLVAELQQSLEENPDNPEGWLMLGRSLKSMQRYPQALNAITRADQLLPGSPVIMVELAEARLFASGNPDMGGEIYQLLQTAVSMDPQQQKGLWLLGMAESQAGNYQRAIDLWTSLLGFLDPASGAAQTVTQQLAAAQVSLSQETGDTRMASGTQTGEQSLPEKPLATGANPASENPTGLAVTPNIIPVELNLNDALPTLPGHAVLFVFVHPAGQKGMPLAVKRIAGPVFPLSISLSDADTLRPDSSLKEHDQLDISARVSMNGVANAASGDYQANTVTVSSNSTSTVVLNFEQRVP